MRARTFMMAGILVLFLFGQAARFQGESAQRTPKTILAIGAHAGDMEISCGAVLARQARLGDKVFLLHLSLGEGGNPRLAPDAYGEQKRKEALAAADKIGAKAIFGPYKDGEIPDSEQARRYVAEIIRQVKPEYLFAHWKNSLHKDHVVAHRLAVDAELLAALPAVKTESPAFRGILGIYFAENWEDKEGFSPYVYIDVAADLDRWESCVKQYEFIRGGISSYPYFDYYWALARVRGAESGLSDAVALDIDPMGKKTILSALP